MRMKRLHVISYMLFSFSSPLQIKMYQDGVKASGYLAQHQLFDQVWNCIYFEMTRQRPKIKQSVVLTLDPVAAKSTANC